MVKESKIALRPLLLNKGDIVTINVIGHSFDRDTIVEGRINGIKEVKHFDPIRNVDESQAWLTYSVVAGVGLFFISFFRRAILEPNGIIYQPVQLEAAILLGWIFVILMLTFGFYRYITSHSFGVKKIKRR